MPSVEFIGDLPPVGDRPKNAWLDEVRAHPGEWAMLRSRTGQSLVNSVSGYRNRYPELEFARRNGELYVRMPKADK